MPMISKTFEASQTAWEQRMSVKILDFIKEEVAAELRFLRIALYRFMPKEDKRLATLATDGENIYYSSLHLLPLFQKNSRYLDRVYLHSVLHCLFSHLWIQGKRNPYLWGIACDIAVEYTIDHMDKECTRRILSLLREQIYGELEASGRSISAAQIYRYLEEFDADRLKDIHMEFFTDDHVFWPKEENKDMPSSKVFRQWQKIARQTSQEQKRRGQEPGEKEAVLNQQLKIQRSRRSYADFLRQFTILREEVSVDPDNFDINYYTYGLNLYKNMPLIEPLESSEVKKIRDFVIVIDTSYSTNGELVQGFLKETFRILLQRGNFFRQSRIHILQCDEKVQEDTVIRSEKDIAQLYQQFTLLGGGGTDFRPAFAYINALIEEGAFEDLCGVLYFTDGKGIYPIKRPPYKTAFLYLEDYDASIVPVWAICHRLEREEFENCVTD